MKIKQGQEDAWKCCIKNNQDPYGKASINYAQRWAEAMEREIAEGRSISEVAERTSHEADTEGITGFMYGCAVSVLSGVWEHGEELRQWHNLDTQIGNEGEEANKSGGVLNPAILNICREERL